MKVYISVTGGPIPYGVHGQVEMTDLPADLAQRVETSLQPDHMEKSISADRELPMPDEQWYELVIMGEAEEPDQARYVFAESQASSELLDLVDELRLAVTDQQMKQVKEQPAEPAPESPAEPATDKPKRKRTSRRRK